MVPCHLERKLELVEMVRWIGVQELVGGISVLRVVRDKRVAPIDGGLPFPTNQSLELSDGIGFVQKLRTVQGDKLVDTVQRTEKEIQGNI